MKIGNIEITPAKTLYKTIKRPLVKDPPRYPKIINGYEDVAKKIYSESLNNMYAGIVKKMVEIEKLK